MAIFQNSCSRIHLLNDAISTALVAQYNINLWFTYSLLGCVGLDSSVGLATRYGLGGPGIEYRWGRDFPHPSRPAPGPTQPPIKWVPGLFSGG